MNKSKYIWKTIYSSSYRPLQINCFTYENNTNYISNLADFRIITNPKPMLKLYCNEYDIQTELYEYAIDYIINNKIGNHKTITYNTIRYKNTSRKVIIIDFDIIDTKLLVQLL